ncbi:MAG: DUF4249 domain-containing protein [Saprospiraceae bacterium]|nr:DUF4249 domain-containing protein [Saprospiraceae bacterium]
MKHILYILGWSFLILSLSSCEDVIELELKNDDPQLVIDAHLNASSQEAQVWMSYSNSFYDNTDSETIDDAMVQLIREDGTSIIVEAKGNGYYKTENINAAVDETFKMQVTLTNGNSYEAIAKVPRPISIDSVSMIATAFGGGFGGQSDSSKQNYQLLTYWKDPVGTEDYYRLKAKKNGADLTDTYVVLDDAGANDENQIFSPFFELFEEGDSVEFSLLSLDKNTYDYFSNLADIQGQGFGATTPFNPENNWSGDILGYFGVIQVDQKSIYLPQ